MAQRCPRRSTVTSLTPHPRIEVLEDRILPAVTVGLSGGLLSVTDTDTTGHAIVVAETPTAGTYTVKVDGTAKPGSPFAGVTAISVITGADADTVTLGGNLSAGTILSGNLAVAGAANLTVAVTAGFNVAGRLTVTDTGASAALSVALTGPDATAGAATITNSGVGGSSFTVSGGAVVSGPVSVSLGAGSDTIVIGNGTALNGPLTVSGGVGNLTLNVGSASLNGDVSLGLGVGSTVVAFNGTTITGNLTQTGVGNESVTLSSVVVGGDVSLNEMGGGSAVTASLGNTTIGTFLSITSGNGNDSINVTTTTVGQNVGLSLGAGSDSVRVDASTIAGNLFLAGTGNASITLDSNGNATTINGYVSINEAGSTASVDATIDAATDQINIGRYLSIIGGDGNNTVTVGSFVTIGQNFGISFGSGHDSVSMYSFADTVEGNLFQSGTGSETVSIGSGLVVGGFLRFQETGAASALDASIDGASVGRFLSLAAGGGNCAIAVTNTEVGTVTPDNLGMSLGAGNATVALAGDTVAGRVFANGAGADSIAISNTTTGQGLNINLSGATGSCMVTLQADVFAGAVSVATGTGADTIRISDSVLDGATTISSGSGADIIILEGTADNMASDFFGPVSVAMGGAGGTLTLGADSADPAIFFAGASFSGGFLTTTNTLTRTAADSLAGPPVVT
jgi:hypothetical protein